MLTKMDISNCLQSRKNRHCVVLLMVTLSFSTTAFTAPFQLLTTTDKKLSSNFFSLLNDNFRDTYAFLSGEERDVIAEGVANDSIYYRGFDLNADALFPHSQISNYSNAAPQKYVINTLNIQVKLKDDKYTIPFVGSFDDIPEENGRIDIQLWTTVNGFSGSWPASEYSVTEIDDGDSYTLSIDFSAKPLDYTDWYNRGEIIVTAWYPSLIADSDFIVDSVKITGDRSLFVAPVPVPAAMWLFGSALLGLAGIGTRRKPA